eukprot:TRINITY_DN48763_c0_g1_i1.p1 TRINITY_DN48763_c0_g1~~TRINITY_DN48763_c0_g1_i1.p1  ORF type:complete len:432 (-),score=131.81 TRINITY_DN48763_c0_g1_i1:106-1347(-)
MASDNAVEDPVEDCSDNETAVAADNEVPAWDPPRTPPGVGRFSKFVGAEKSEGRQPRAASGGQDLPEDLSSILDTVPANLEDLLDNVEDTVPGGSQALLAATGLLDDQDGTTTVAGDEVAAALERLGNELPGDLSEDSDDDPGPREEPLPAEPWQSYPARERELWERQRPRALRREAQDVRSLRLPQTAVTRLMRLHPHLPLRSAEAVEIINLSTVMFLQSVTRAAARGSGKTSGGIIGFEDLRQACQQIKELQFLHPLNCSLDPSSFVLRKTVGDEAEDGKTAKRNGIAKSAEGSAQLRAGQARLGAAFLNAKKKDGEEEEEEDAVEAEEVPEHDGEVTPKQQERSEAPGSEKVGSKRKAPPSSSKKAGKAPRRASDDKKPRIEKKKVEGDTPVPAGKSIAGFFRRIDTAGG